MTEQAKYRDASLPTEARVDDLVGRMSLGSPNHLRIMVGRNCCTRKVR